MFLQSLHLPFINLPLTTLSRSHPLFPSSSSSSSSYRLPTSLPQRTRNTALWIAQASESSTTTATTTSPPEEEGPIELLPSSPSIFATNDDPSPLQITTSILLTGAISVFLFRSLRRRAKRAKEMRFRSTGVKKTIQEEAMDSLKALTPVEEGSPPSPIQALLGGISAGIVALVLYKFTLTVEAGLNRQNISDDFSVRQITITVRTIINGLCYLATFVFGINGIGLVLYSGQLALNSFMEGGSTDKDSSRNDDEQLSSITSSTNSSADNGSSNNNDKDQRSDEAQ